MGLNVNLCGISLDNPVIPASGTFGFGYEFAQLYDINILGTFSFKGTTKDPRFGNPTPRIAECPGGMINAVGLQNPGVEAVIAQELPTLRQVFHKPVMANVSGFSVQEYAEASRLGVPVLVSMDSVHGLSYVSGATVTGHNLALAATRDEELVTRLAEISRDEHIAIGVRMTLSPESDIASEPRWGRVMETFGEDPDLVTQMVRAQR